LFHSHLIGTKMSNRIFSRKMVCPMATMCTYCCDHQLLAQLIQWKFQWQIYTLCVLARTCTIFEAEKMANFHEVGPYVPISQNPTKIIFYVHPGNFSFCKICYGILLSFDNSRWYYLLGALLYQLASSTEKNIISRPYLVTISHPWLILMTYLSLPVWL